jgi:hypothetical protein
MSASPHGYAEPSGSPPRRRSVQLSPEAKAWAKQRSITENLPMGDFIIESVDRLMSTNARIPQSQPDVAARRTARATLAAAPEWWRELSLFCVNRGVVQHEVIAAALTARKAGTQ